MPRMDGRQFLTRVKNLSDLHRIPVVVLTTSDAEADIVSAYDHGAAGFIVKPVDVNQFVQKVQGLQEYWISLVRHPAH